MNEIHFADILLILLVLALTFGILYLVNRGKSQPKTEKVDADAAEEQENPD